MKRFEPQRLHVFFLVLAAFALYSRTLDNYWIKDDLAMSVFLEGSELSWPKMKTIFWPDHLKSEHHWRPVPFLSIFVDYWVWGTNPIGYHIKNTFLHALVGILTYLLLNRLTNFRAPALGFAAGLAVIVNPINPEAVAWSVQRIVPICALFCLTGMLAWLKAVESGRTRWRLLGYVCLTLAIFTKEVGCTLPGCYFLIDVFYAPAARRLKRRVTSGLLAAIPSALILAFYFVCRYLMWGRLDIKYAGLDPWAYARELRVFERMGDSLFNCIVPVNAGVFSDPWRQILQGMILGAFALAAVRGLMLIFVSSYFRRAGFLMLTFFALSFVPSMLIFWVDERLFNGRFFYQPGIALVSIAAMALWLPGRREFGGGARRFLQAAVPYTGTALLVLGYAISLAGGLTAFDEGGDQVRGIQTGVVEYAKQQRRAGGDPVVVAVRTPSQIKGVPTLEHSLRLAVMRPYNDFDLKCIPLVDVYESTGEWADQLRTIVERDGIDLSRLRYVVCHREPPGALPMFGAPEPAHGPYPVKLLGPPDRTFTTNDGEEPTFRFAPTGPAARFVLHMESRDRAEPVRLTIIAGKNAVRGEDGTISYRLSNRDAENAAIPDLWTAIVKQPLPYPLPVTWRIESYDATGSLVGVSEDRRVVVFNRIFADE